MDPVIIGPLIALGFIGLLVAVRVILAASKKAPVESKTKVLVHAINDERCTGCCGSGPLGVGCAGTGVTDPGCCGIWPF